MATYVLVANTAAQRIGSASTTDKIRIATTTDIHYAIGNSSVNAATTDAIVPAGQIFEDFIGVGKYVSVIRVTSTSANGAVSITELGTASSGTAAVS
jgi:hypothetical protein